MRNKVHTSTQHRSKQTIQQAWAAWACYSLLCNSLIVRWTGWTGAEYPLARVFLKQDGSISLLSSDTWRTTYLDIITDLALLVRRLSCLSCLSYPSHDSTCKIEKKTVMGEVPPPGPTQNQHDPSAFIVSFGLLCESLCLQLRPMAFWACGGLRWRNSMDQHIREAYLQKSRDHDRTLENQWVNMTKLLCFAFCFPCRFHFLPALKPVPVKKLRKHVEIQSGWHKENALDADSAVQTYIIRSIPDASNLQNQRSGRSRWNITEDSCVCFFSSFLQKSYIPVFPGGTFASLIGPGLIFSKACWLWGSR